MPDNTASRAKSRDSSLRDSAWIYGGGLALCIAAFALAYQFVDPAPPSRITLSTGGKTGAYHSFGEAYRRVLARHGVELVLTPSAGSVENLQRLDSGQADVAFVQGGLGRADDERFYALASLYHEPVWIFHRKDTVLRDLGDLRALQLKYSVGPAGSGTRAVAQVLLSHFPGAGRVGAASTPAGAVELGAADTAAALAAGELEAGFFVASADSSPVQRLLHSDQVSLLSLERAEAYQRIHHYLAPVTLPRGVIDLREDNPPVDVRLLATTANLVARADLHPAIVNLLMQAAHAIHAGGDLFAEPGQFPSPHRVDFPLSPEAERFFRSGPPLLQRYLPFWGATLVDRLKVMLVPLIALAIPLGRLLPPLYRWRVRRRVYRWYGELRELEERTQFDGHAVEPLLKRLERIETDALQVEVPWGYAEELYNLRLHIDYVRRRLGGGTRGDSTSP